MILILRGLGLNGASLLTRGMMEGGYPVAASEFLGGRQGPGAPIWRRQPYVVARPQPVVNLYDDDEVLVLL